MNTKLQLKKQILNRVLEIVEEKHEEAVKAIQQVKESRDNESKNSVGDKYETGRSMLMFEMEKHTLQLQKAQMQKHELSQINLHKKPDRVQFGSLVFTNRGAYFLSIALGKITVEGENIFCISPVSPFGKLIQNKTTGDKFSFQENEFILLELY